MLINMKLLFVKMWDLLLDGVKVVSAGFEVNLDFNTF